MGSLLCSAGVVWVGAHVFRRVEQGEIMRVLEETTASMGFDKAMYGKYKVV